MSDPDKRIEERVANLKKGMNDILNYMGLEHDESPTQKAPNTASEASETAESRKRKRDNKSTEQTTIASSSGSKGSK